MPTPSPPQSSCPAYARTSTGWEGALFQSSSLQLTPIVALLQLVSLGSPRKRMGSPDPAWLHLYNLHRITWVAVHINRSNLYSKITCVENLTSTVYTNQGCFILFYFVLWGSSSLAPGAQCLFAVGAHWVSSWSISAM